MKNIIITLASVATLAGAANAQTVSNGSFETIPGTGNLFTGVPTGWYYSPDAGQNRVNVLTHGNYTGEPAGVTGARYLESAFLGDTGRLTQTITGFTVGEIYQLTFDWGNRAGGDTHGYDFDVTIGNQAFSRKGRDQRDFEQKSLTFTATNTSHELLIHFKDQSSNTNGAFDNFQISQVPEPSSTALLGLGGLALLLRRKK